MRLKALGAGAMQAAGPWVHAAVPHDLSLYIQDSSSRMMHRDCIEISRQWSQHCPAQRTEVQPKSCVAGQSRKRPVICVHLIMFAISSVWRTEQQQQQSCTPVILSVLHQWRTGQQQYGMCARQAPRQSVACVHLLLSTSSVPIEQQQRQSCSPASRRYFLWPSCNTLCACVTTSGMQDRSGSPHCCHSEGVASLIAPFSTANGAATTGTGCWSGRATSEICL